LQSLQLNRGLFVLGISCFLTGLFVHVVRPENQYYWITVTAYVGVIVFSRAFSHPLSGIQAIFIGVTVQVVSERLLSWYPYTAWHHVPLFVWFALSWCVVAWVFSENQSDRAHLVSAICLVGLIRERVISDSVTMAGVGEVMSNQFWAALLMLLFMDSFGRLLRQFKLRKYPVI
jgi:hypothetical protein